MVSPPTVNVGGLAMPPTQKINQSAHPVNITRSSTSCLEHLRERFSGQAKLQNLSSGQRQTNLINSLFGRWSRWCSERGSDPFSGPVSVVANFLAVLYQEGYHYNLVNAFRSSISSVHERV